MVLSSPADAPTSTPLPPPSGRRLRIAFVVHDYNRHIGHSRYVAELASRFRLEHEVHVFTNTVDDPDVAGLTFHHIPALRFNALASAVSFIPLGTLLVRGRFDVIHAQGLCGYRHNLATAHFCQPAWYDALLRHGVRLTWKQQMFRRLLSKLERRALCQPTTKRVIAISELMRTNLSQLYGRQQNVDLVYHGTDIVGFHPSNRERYRIEVRSAAGIGDDRFTALYVGDLKKGAAAAIRATAKAPGATLLLLTGSQTAPFRALAEAEGVADRTIFLPFSKKVATFFAAADAFVFPTIYDPFGLVITEAMASGLPVITSRAAGASELITTGTDGLLTEDPWDADSIAAHLCRLRDDPGLRERLGSAARARIEPFTWDRTASETLVSYRRIVDEVAAER
jgi:UDP-glucose:(heptosyl)LPS alpha-1,3-glucosyltransferase